MIMFSAAAGIMSSVFEKSVSGLIAASGVAGLVIGFAVKEVISDFFSGIILNISPPYQIGDWIKLENDEWAKVMEVNWRATIFEDFYCNTLIIPNSKMSTMTIRNFERPKKHTVQTLEFYLDFELPTERAMNMIKAAAKEGQYALGITDKSLEPIVGITDISQIGVKYFLYYYIPDVNAWIAGKALVFGKVVNHLFQAGVRPVYPRHEIFTSEFKALSLRVRNQRDLLTRADMFLAMIPEEIEDLAKKMKECTFQPGDVIVRQGEEGSSMFFMFEGLVNVLIDFKGEGEQTKVANIGPGQFFGEMSLLTGEPRTATISADVPTIVYELSKADLKVVLEKRPECADTISQIVAERQISTQAAAKNLDSRQLEQETRSFAADLLKKIKGFFRIGGR
ncbi:MAG: mechanosensitive ion channel family protein [Planctomycetota bacterium]|nr:mechanosensitive ion channel family protein [Planctomycetota bacterium]